MKSLVLKFLLLPILAIYSLSSYSQFSKVVDTHTMNIIHTTFFSFIDKHFDSISTRNFELLKKENKNIIYFGITPYSKIEKSYQFLLEDWLFMQFVKSPILDSSIKFKVQKIKTIKFKRKNEKIEKINCSIDIFPLLKYNGRTYLKALALSPGFDDNMYGTYLYFIFNSDLDLISVKIHEFSM